MLYVRLQISIDSVGTLCVGFYKLKRRLFLLNQKSTRSTLCVPFSFSLQQKSGLTQSTEDRNTRVINSNGDDDDEIYPFPLFQLNFFRNFSLLLQRNMYSNVYMPEKLIRYYIKCQIRQYYFYPTDICTGIKACIKLSYVRFLQRPFTILSESYLIETSDHEKILSLFFPRVRFFCHAFS